MKHILSIGEYLIDMLPEFKGMGLKDVQTFIKMPGGAPVNVAVAIKRLGGSVDVVTQVGNDAFGHFLIDVLKKEHLDLTYVSQTDQAKTSLAFVSLDEHGERDFVFYRDPAADQLLNLKPSDLLNVTYDILHFGSVGLADYPLKDSTDLMIKHAQTFEKIISFDVNVRHMLFKDSEAYKKTILLYIKKAHIIKFSEEELSWLTGSDDTLKSLGMIWEKHHHIMLVSRGSDGVSAYTKEKSYHQKANKVEVVDTTGAGDALMGCFLYMLSLEKQPFDSYDLWLPKALEISAYAASMAITKKGAMASLPYIYEIIKK